MFGDSLLVGALSDEIHLPEGKWIDYWTGKEYDGNITLKDAYPKDKGGYLFIKKGAIIPYWEDVLYVGQKKIDSMTIKIYPDNIGEYTIYEDDGITFEFEEGIYAKTKISYTVEDDKTVVTIGKKEGEFKIPDRDYHVEVYMNKPTSLPENAVYDEDKKAVCFTMKGDSQFVI